MDFSLIAKSLSVLGSSTATMKVFEFFTIQSAHCQFFRSFEGGGDEF